MSAPQRVRGTIRPRRVRATQRDTGALVRSTEPSSLTARERHAEIGEILATALLRYREKSLAARAEGERPCHPTVDTKEVA